jgi:hypothetical protein
MLLMLLSEHPLKCQLATLDPLSVQPLQLTALPIFLRCHPWLLSCRPRPCPRQTPLYQDAAIQERTCTRFRTEREFAFRERVLSARVTDPGKTFAFPDAVLT